MSLNGSARVSAASAAGHAGEIQFPALAAAEQSPRIFAGSASEGLYLVEFGQVLSASTPKHNESSVPGGH